MANKSKNHKQGQQTVVNKKRGDQPGDKKVNRHKSKKPVFRGETLTEGLRKDRQHAREQRAADLAAAEARRTEFAERQHELALGSPYIVNDRLNGGVDGYARTLATRLVNLWADTPKSAVEAAKAEMTDPAKADKVTRMGLAVRQLNAQLREEYTQELREKRPELSSEEVKTQVNERVKREYHLRGKAMTAARDAVQYGFNKAKAGQ